MSLRPTTRNPSIYRPWSLIAAINSLATVLAMTRTGPAPSLPGTATARAILRSRQVVVAARGQLVPRLVTSLVPRFCIASPPYSSPPRIGGCSADTTTLPPGSRQWFMWRMPSSTSARLAGASSSSGFTDGQKIHLQGQRHTPMAVSFGN